MTEQSEPRFYQIGGRRYRLIRQTTFENDDWVERRALHAGIHKMHVAKGESDEDFAVRLYYKIVESGRKLELLAGLMVPDSLTDADWTPELAGETMNIFRRLTDPAEKKALDLAVFDVNAFFALGLLSKQPSPTVSAEGQPVSQAAAPAS